MGLGTGSRFKILDLSTITQEGAESGDSTIKLITDYIFIIGRRQYQESLPIAGVDFAVFRGINSPSILNDDLFVHSYTQYTEEAKEMLYTEVLCKLQKFCTKLREDHKERRKRRDH